MPNSVMQYQSRLLRELVEDAEQEANLSEADAETLRQHIDEATSEPEIAKIWAELDDDFQILDEDQWAR